MEADLAQRLIDLNRRFYQNFAAAFADTRERLQPGVLRVLDGIPAQADVLDLGCGSGALAVELARRRQRGSYVGVDFSEELLAIARSKIQGPIPRSARDRLSNVGRKQGFEPSFVQLDLTTRDWSAQLAGQKFDYVLAFAVLHHLPGEEIRLRLLRQVHGLLKAGGRFTHSNWQFLNSERLRQRIQAWESVGILDEEVDEWDYLLDWRRDGEGLRYVHYFTEEELADLAAKAGFVVLDSFYSDGDGGKLGLYQVWVAGEE